MEKKKLDNSTNLFKELSVIYKKNEEKKRTMTDFNVFESISKISHEKIHSKFIYTLLNDRIYGKKFLVKLLIEYLNFEENLSPEVIEKMNVYYEYPIPFGRLDLKIEFETTSKQKTLIKEIPKIYTIRLKFPSFQQCI